MFATPIAIYLALATFGRGPEPAPAGPADLTGPAGRALATLLATPVFDDDLTVGVAVRCTSDDRLWATSAADTLLNAASGTKLLTTAAALTKLPANVRWATTAHGLLSEGTVAGDLVVVGRGDPWLETADLVRLAEALKAAGLRRVTGDVVADTSHLDGSPLPPGYDQKSTDAAYRPAVPALGIAFGTTLVGVRPGKSVGSPVRVTATPGAPSIVIESSATTVAGKDSDKLAIDVRAGDGGKTRIIVTGTLGLKAAAQAVKKRVEDPARVAAEVFVAALAKNGIEVAGKVRVETAPAPLGPELARVESRGLTEIVHEINTFSNNFMAETLFAHLGEDASGRASWSRAARAVTDALAELGVARDAVRIVNGSGLYDATHVSPRGMVALLDRMVDVQAFHDSLAIAGKTGTLRKRLKSLAGKVVGKTGTLDDALSLSGYVTAKSGCPLAFSVIVNGPIGDDAAKVQVAIDRFVGALVEL